MATEARRSGLDPREASTLPTFTPDNAAALPAPPLKKVIDKVGDAC